MKIEAKPGVSANSGLAKLVIGVGALVALATGDPQWVLEDEQHLNVVLDDVERRKLLVTLELGGALYADAFASQTALTVTTSRAASDVTFAVERVGRIGDGSSTGGDDAGAEGDPGERRWVASFTLESPARAAQGVALRCPPSESEPRQATCIDQLEITLARESASPLQAQLTVATSVTGHQAKAPRGTFAVSIEEIVP